MENLVNITIQQIAAIGILLVVLILLFAWLGKKGIFSFNAKGITIGTGQNLERRVILRQFEYIDASIQEQLNLLNLESDNKWLYICTSEKVKDILQKAVTLNHISTEEAYIKTKQLAVWSEIAKVCPKAKQQDFKEKTYIWVKKTFEDLLSVRQSIEKSKN